jgi:hypothetical protein
MNFPETITLKQVLSHHPCFSGLVEALIQLKWKLTAAGQAELLSYYEKTYGPNEEDRFELRDAMRGMRSKASDSYPIAKAVKACVNGSCDYTFWVGRILGINLDEYSNTPIKTQLELAFLRSEVARLTRASKKVLKAA